MTHNGNTIAYLLLFDAAIFFLHLSPHTISAKGKKKKQKCESNTSLQQKHRIIFFLEKILCGIE